MERRGRGCLGGGGHALGGSGGRHTPHDGLLHPELIAAVGATEGPGNQEGPAGMNYHAPLGGGANEGGARTGRMGSSMERSFGAFGMPTLNSPPAISKPIWLETK